MECVKGSERLCEGKEVSQRPKIHVSRYRSPEHWQENLFRAWSKLSYLCRNAAGIKLRAATEKMIPIGMTSLRLYLIRCLYVILLHETLFFKAIYLSFCTVRLQDD